MVLVNKIIHNIFTIEKKNEILFPVGHNSVIINS